MMFKTEDGELCFFLCMSISEGDRPKCAGPCRLPSCWQLHRRIIELWRERGIMAGCESGVIKEEKKSERKEEGGR